jgi:hypothetical protein
VSFFLAATKGVRVGDRNAAICGVHRNCLAAFLCYGQGFMKFVRTLLCGMGMCVLCVSASAQEAATPQVAERLFPASFEGIAPSVSTSVEPLPAPIPLEKSAAPTLAAQHKFFDRQQMLALYVHSGVRLADTIKTCRELSHGGTEDWIPSQSCAGVAAWQAGSVGLTLGIGWLFHQRGHHTLERWTPWVATAASTAGLAKSVFNIH